MLAKETEEPFDDKDWLYEIKWDGYRAIAEVSNGNVKLYSRNGNTFENSYPIIVDELKKIKRDIVIDGEVVVRNLSSGTEFIKENHAFGAGIIYTYSRKDADTVASTLCDYGVIAEVSSSNSRSIDYDGQEKARSNMDAYSSLLSFTGLS